MSSAVHFDWVPLWPETSQAPDWSHSGIAVLRNGSVAFAAPSGESLLVLNPESGERSIIGTSLLEMHGITIDPLSDHLWIADPGLKPRPEADYRPRLGQGRVVRMSLYTNEFQELPQPKCTDGKRWRPTAVVANTDDVWVADGYGASLVHRFDRAGRHIQTLSGAETGTRFDCPHGLVLDPRHHPSLVVADRGNRRLAVYTLDGTFVREIRSELLTAPSGLAISGNDLIVTDLHGGLLAVDRDDAVRPLVEPAAPRDRDAPWPNHRVNGKLVRPMLEPRQLHSPHGVAVGADGSIYLTEWMIGGRQLRLQPVGTNSRSARAE